MTLALNDWVGAVGSCPIRVNLVQGKDDPNVPIASSRAFAEAFPEQCRLTEISGGGLLSYSRVDLLVDELMRI